MQNTVIDNEIDEGLVDGEGGFGKPHHLGGEDGACLQGFGEHLGEIVQQALHAEYDRALQIMVGGIGGLDNHLAILLFNQTHRHLLLYLIMQPFLGCLQDVVPLHLGDEGTGELVDGEDVVLLIFFEFLFAEGHDADAVCRVDAGSGFANGLEFLPFGCGQQPKAFLAQVCCSIVIPQAGLGAEGSELDVVGDPVCEDLFMEGEDVVPRYIQALDSLMEEGAHRCAQQVVGGLRHKHAEFAQQGQEDFVGVFVLPIDKQPCGEQADVSGTFVQLFFVARQGACSYLFDQAKYPLRQCLNGLDVRISSLLLPFLEITEVLLEVLVDFFGCQFMPYWCAVFHIFVVLTF